MPYIKYKGNKVLRVLNKRQLLAELKDVEIPEELTADFLKKHSIAELPPFPTPPDLREDKHNKLAFEYKKGKDGWERTVTLAPVHEGEVEARWDAKCAEVRGKRNRLLAETDWTQLADIDKKVKDKYKHYRKKLRDIPIQEGFPFLVAYPKLPE